MDKGCEQISIDWQICRSRLTGTTRLFDIGILSQLIKPFLLDKEALRLGARQR